MRGGNAPHDFDADSDTERGNARTVEDRPQVPRRDSNERCAPPSLRPWGKAVGAFAALAMHGLGELEPTERMAYASTAIREQTRELGRLFHRPGHEKGSLSS